LKRLAAAGLAAKKTERKKGTPDRYVYSLTAEGREQLRSWLKVPVAEAVPRNELLLKLFFGAHVSPTVSRDHVQAYLNLHKEKLQAYGAIAKVLRKDEANDPQLPFWLMTLNLGRHHSAATVKWCRETLAELDQLERRQKGGR
jgi:DNA-binding PadR family transcriptional regulator